MHGSANFEDIGNRPRVAKRQNIVVERFSGLSPSGTTHFDPDGKFIGNEEAKKTRTGAGMHPKTATLNADAYQFFSPNSNNKSCKSCKAGKTGS